MLVCHSKKIAGKWHKMYEGRDGMTSANKKLLVVDDEPDFCVFVSHVAKETPVAQVDRAVVS